MHHLLTHKTLEGFEHKDSALWQKLNQKIETRPLDEFIRNVFGPKCNWSAMKDSVLQGVGKNYQVVYVEDYQYYNEVDWSKSLNQVHLIFNAEHHNLHPAIEILSTYSNEPDWFLDDDVPRLKNKGPVEGLEGIGTRLLRHFWYEGQKEDDVELDKDQETDQRMQLLYELALVAFYSGEEYWGYRYLGNAIHYLQDVTQPFHSLAIINHDMLDNRGIRRGVICEMARWARDHGTGNAKLQDCKTNDTLANAVIKSANIIGTYHALYEDYVRALFETPSSTKFVPRDSSPFLEGKGDLEGPIDVIDWGNPSVEQPLLDLRKAIRSTQRAILPFAERIGELVFRLLGRQYHDDVEVAQAQVRLQGSSQSAGYRIATTFAGSLPQRQYDTRTSLLDLTEALLLRTGIWSRTFFQKALPPYNPEQQYAIAQIKEKFQRQCAGN